MFYIHGPIGRVFAGNLEQLRQVDPAHAIVRPRAPEPVGGRDESPGLDPNAPGQAPVDAPAGGLRGALAAYARAMHAGESDARAPLRRVADVMSHPALVLPAALPVAEAMQRLAAAGHAQAPVVDVQQRLVGLFLRADLLPSAALLTPGPGAAVPAAERAARQARAWAQDWSSRLAQPVQALMRSPVPAAGRDTALRQVATVLLASGLPALPVSDEHAAVLGLVTRSDLLRAISHDPPLDLWAD